MEQFNKITEFSKCLQISSKFHQISPNFSKLHQSSDIVHKKLKKFKKLEQFHKTTKFSKNLQISSNFTKFLQISPNFSKFHQSSKLVYI